MSQSLRRIFLRFAVPAIAVALAATSCSDDGTVAPTDSTATGDLTAPTRVTDPAISWDAVGHAAVLTWTAPSDNDRVASYDIRYSYSFPLQWDLSLRVDDPPVPLEPGTPQSYAIVDPQGGREIYAAIRSVDPSGNASPTSAVAQLLVPGYKLDIQCVVATTSAPVEGLDVTISSRHVTQRVTDAAGRTGEDDIAGGAVNVAIRPGASGVPYYHMDDPFNIDSDRSVLYKMIPYGPTEKGVYETTLKLFKAAAGFTTQNTIFKKWYHVPVATYIPPLVNDNGLDYGAICRSAVERWEDRTGLDLWEFVDAPPDTGVTFTFKTRAEMGIQVGITHHDQDDFGYPLTDNVWIVDDYANQLSVFITMMHELGHTIRFQHLPSGYLMYGGQPLPSDVTNDEVLAAQIYTALPNGLDIRIYDDSVPAEATR